MIKTFHLPHEENEKSIVDVVFSFDTTGSMATVLDGLRKNLSATIKKLFADVPNIRIGIIAHGDYCDAPNFFWMLQPTKNKEAITAFIKFAPSTGGGDYPECYELVLHEANKICWTAETRVLVVIGDATPHEPGYSHDGVADLAINWRTEAELAKENNITIFSCHAKAGENKESLAFYDQISRTTGGYYFTLDNLQSFKDYMMAICLHAADGAETKSVLESYRSELDARLAGLLTAEERQQLTAEAEEVYSALEAVNSQGTFSPSATVVREKILTSRGTPSRRASFRAESDPSMNTLFSTFGGAELSTPVRPPRHRTMSPIPRERAEVVRPRRRLLFPEHYQPVTEMEKQMQDFFST
jgi:hypothetical protein